MKSNIVSAVVLVLLAVCNPVYSAGVGFGLIQSSSLATGLDTTFDYGFTFVNDYTSTLNVVSIVVNGNTAYTRPLTWAQVSPFTLVNDGNVYVSGVGTEQVVLDIDPIDSFNPGEYISNDQFYPASIGGVNTPARDMLGVQATFIFDDASTWIGVLSDIPALPGSPFPYGLAYLQPVPLPPTIYLFGFGVFGLLVMRRENIWHLFSGPQEDQRV